MRKLPELGDVGRELVEAMGITTEKFEIEAMRMFAGKCKSSPFSSEEIRKGKVFLNDWCVSWGYDPRKREGDVNQEVNIRLLQAFLHAAGDPEADALDGYAVGVSTGHNRRMPRTPAVFEAKKKWRLDYEPPEKVSEVWAKNYKTADDNKKALKEKVEEDLVSGRLVRMTYAQAKAIYGDRLLIGALGMVDEGQDRFRLIHDGTHVILVNNRIRPRDLVASPLIQDIAAEMAEIQDTKMSHISFVWDFKSAHRIVPVAKEDWGLQACTIDGKGMHQLNDEAEVLLNTVGTFGISSAGYWWGRLAAAIVRAMHYAAGHSRKAWLLLYADDGKLTMPLAMFRQLLPIVLALFEVLDVPVKWEKVKGGFEYQWIGYWSSLTNFTVGISEGRRRWVLEWLDQVLEEKEPSVDFDSGLGRLSFVCGATVYDKPFLAPLFSLAAATRRHYGRKVDMKRLPPFVKFILFHLRSRLTERASVNCKRGRPRASDVVERFRTDAKAEGDLVTVGGYQSFGADGKEIPKKDAKWFYLKLDRASAPWAFARGEPFRAIASLELLGTLLGLMLLIDEASSTDDHFACALSVGGITDNNGNRYAVTKMLTTKWPLLAFLAELSIQLEARGILIEVNWVPREQNAEADAITNGDFGWLAPENKVDTHMGRLPFKLLPELLAKGEGFYAGYEAVNLGAEPGMKDMRSLRVRAPWDT